jgi:hypothetical protein
MARYARLFSVMPALLVATGAAAQVKTTQTQEPLQSERARKALCARIVAEYGSDLSIDADACTEKGIVVTSKTVAAYKPSAKAPVQISDKSGKPIPSGTALITRLEVTAQIGATVCQATLERQFARLEVKGDGGIAFLHDSWDIAVDSCDKKSSKSLKTARPGEPNVFKMSAAKFKTLKQSVRENIAAFDLGLELGDGYYDVVKSAYHVVLDPANGSKVLGFIQEARVAYTEDNDESDYLVFYDEQGNYLSYEGY